MGSNTYNLQVSFIKSYVPINVHVFDSTAALGSVANVVDLIR